MLYKKMKYLLEEVGEPAKATESTLKDPAAKQITDRIKRPQYWRQDAGEILLTPHNFDSYHTEHTAITPNNSAIIGVDHTDMTNRKDVKNATNYVKSHAIPTALTTARKALKLNKPIHFVAEGWKQPDTQSRNTEQWALISALRQKIGHKNIISDTWDDHTVNFLDDKSPIWNKLTEYAGNDSALAKSAIAIDMLGQTSQGTGAIGPEVKKLLTPEVTKHLQSNFNIDPHSLTKKQAAHLYTVAWPGDSGKPQNKYSSIIHALHHERELNLMKKVHEIEKRGGIAIAAGGGSHIWNLKHTFEKGAYTNVI